MRKRLGTGLLVIGLVLLAGFAGKTATLHAQQPLPEDCVVMIHTDSLQGSVDKISNLVSQVNPMLGQMAPLFMPKIIGTASMNGINTTGSLTGVLLNPEKYQPAPLVRIVSITDQQAALQSFGLGARPEGEQNGIHTFARLDQMRFLQATPEEKQNIEQFIQKRFYVGFAGNSALVADSPEACAAVLGMVQAGTLNPAAASSLKGDIILNVNIKDLMRIYGDRIDQELAPFKAIMKQGMRVAQMPQPNVNPEGMANLVDVYVDGIVWIVKQLDALELALVLGEDGIRLRSSLTARPDSEIASIIQQQTPAGTDILRFIPSDSFLAVAANFKFTQEAKDRLVGFTGDILDSAQTPMPPEQRQAMLENARKAMEIFGGELGLGMIFSGEEQQGGLTFVEVFSAANPATAYSELMKQFDQSAMFLGFYKNVMGLNIELATTENAATHQGVSITEVAVLFDPETFPPEAREMLRKFYGDPMILRAAVVDKYVIVTFGQDSLARMKQTIEFVKAGAGSDLTAQPDFASGTRGFPKNTNLVLFISPREIAKFVRGLAPPMGMPGGAQEAQPELELKGGIGAYVLAKGNRLEGELYVPQEFIDSLKGLFMGQMGGMQPGPGVPPQRPVQPPMPK